ncbi:MAG: catechol 2,3-dioxygenase-like lactoylglutathione lyase family enzyme [Limisphaerales bacterium]|jgi:catechol 2,3-dioxygenase-like lactoylglutathione lyase family enzyme
MSLLFGPVVQQGYVVPEVESAMQHLAFWVDDIDEKLAQLDDKGVKYKVWQRYGAPPSYQAHAYLDLVDNPGVMIQLMARSEFYDMMFGLLEDAASDWDGESAPIRNLDPASGTLVERV